MHIHRKKLHLFQISALVSVLIRCCGIRYPKCMKSCFLLPLKLWYDFKGKRKRLVELLEGLLQDL